MTTPSRAKVQEARRLAATAENVAVTEWWGRFQEIVRILGAALAEPETGGERDVNGLEAMLKDLDSLLDRHIRGDLYLAQAICDWRESFANYIHARRALADEAGRECSCGDWKSGVAALDAMIAVAFAHGMKYPYSDKPFKFCPWCGGTVRKGPRE